MNLSNLSEFIEAAKNSPLVIADFESRYARLHAMLEIRKEDKSPILNHWIAEAEKRITALRPLYDAAIQARVLPLEALVDIHNQLKALNDG